MANYRKITQAISYLINKNDKANVLPEVKIVKLLWAADRYHLRKYGRSVSDDEYLAMQWGPVGSMAKDILEHSCFPTNGLNEDDFSYIGEFISSDHKGRDSMIFSLRDTDESQMSESDREALDFAWNKLGDYTIEEIVDFSHKYPEWKKHEDALKSERSVKMDIYDFFECTDEDEVFVAEPDQLKATKYLYYENKAIEQLLGR